MMSDAGCPLLLTGAGRTGRQDNVNFFKRSIEISRQLACLNVISTLRTQILIYSAVLHFLLHYDVVPKSYREI